MNIDRLLLQLLLLGLTLRNSLPLLWLLVVQFLLLLLLLQQVRVDLQEPRDHV